MLLNDFKKEKINAMKEKNADAVTALNVVINKLMLLGIEKKAKGEELNDADSVSVLQKAEKELSEEKLAFEKAGRADTVESLDRQLETIKKYLPKMMSADEIRAIIDSLSDRSVPSVMKHFKTNYAGKVDMKTVNEVLRGI